MQAAYGYDMLNELDEYNLSQQPLKGQLICAKCGSHYDLRGAKCYRVWLDNGKIDKICQHCGGNMWPEPEPAAPGEPDLQALLAECLEKIQALGIKTGKIACIRWKKHASGFYGCCGEQNGEFEIQISELYRRGEENVARLRDTIFHELLHTCDRCDNHDQEFWDYARRLDEAYGTHVFFAEPGHDSSPRPKRQEKNISIMLEECVHKLRQIGIEPGNILRIEWIFEYVELGRCQKTEDGFVIQIADRCQNVQITDADLQDIITHQLLHTCLGCDVDTHNWQWLTYARQVDAAFCTEVAVCKADYEFFNSEEKVKTYMKCSNCGSLRSVRDSFLYNVFGRGKHSTCDWCGGIMLMQDKKRSKAHNLNKLLKQCLSEVQKLGIATGEIRNIIYVFLAQGYGTRVKIATNTYEIPIPYHYRSKEDVDEKRMKALIMHNILHSCTEYGVDSHNQQWFEYARQIETTYGYEILLDSPYNPVGMYQGEVAYQGTCPGCGCRVEIFGERNLEYIRNQHRQFCSFCGADLEI